MLNPLASLELQAEFPPKLEILIKSLRWCLDDHYDAEYLRDIDADLDKLDTKVDRKADLMQQWRAPESHHVLQLFMMNQAYLKSEIYKGFEDKEKVMLPIWAMVYVPRHAITALCFPDINMGVEIPHMDLLLQGKTTALDVSTILLNTCRDPDKFQPHYQKLK